MKIKSMLALFICFNLALTNLYCKQNNEKDMIKYPQVAVPDWAKKVVWYQIFPERFRNGDKKNDPTVKDIQGSWPHDNTSPWQVHPWTSDWYQLQPYEKKNGKNIWYNIQRRRYGGDIQGIIDKLDYLQELGIGAIYLNPVFESPSSHKYDGATYHHIDPNFGPDPSGDRKLIQTETPHDPTTWIWTSADKLFLELIKKLHQRNIRIIIDGVFNHMGLNSWAFKDVVQHQQKSIYKDWFDIKSWDNAETGKKFDYRGWFGFKELPELREDENGIVAGPKKYIFDITKRWMDPNNDGNVADGIDGWRLDVAFCVSHAFWQQWRQHVKSINPDAYLTAEVIDPIPVLQPYLAGDEFDAVMNYNFAFACVEYFINEENKISTTKFDQLLQELRDGFNSEIAYVQQNLFGSHDANRIGSQIVNRNLGHYRNWGNYHGISRGENPKYQVRKPNEDEIRIQKLFAIFQMTYLGAPMIYYGDEAGMWGANDPCCRKPMIWDDLNFDAELFLPNQAIREQPDVVEVNADLSIHYQKLIKIRNEQLALQLGDFKTILADDKNDIYAFSRNYKNESIVVILNNKKMRQAVELLVDGKKFVDLLNGNEYILPEGKRLKIELPEKWGRILKKV